MGRFRWIRWAVVVLAATTAFAMGLRGPVRREVAGLTGREVPLAARERGRMQFAADEAIEPPLFERVPGVPWVRQLFVAAGEVWVTTGTELLRFPPGAPERGVFVLHTDHRLYRRVAEGAGSGASKVGLDGAVVDPAGDVWVLTASGALLHRSVLGWSVAAGIEENPRRQPRGLALLEGSPVQLGRSDYGGIHVWKGRWVKAREWPNLAGLVQGESGRLFGSRDETLLVLAQGPFGDATARVLWKGETERRGEVRAVLEDAQGNLVVGTRTGIRMLATSGKETDRALSEVRVNALARDAAGRLWVAGHDGLHVRLESGWHRYGPAEGLPPGEARHVAVDSRGFLWCDCAGLRAAPSDAVAQRVESLPRPFLIPVRRFASPLEAWAALLGDAAESGGVALEPVGDEWRLFLGNRLAWPQGPATYRTLRGYRASSGRFVELGPDGRLRLVTDGEATTFDPPAARNPSPGSVHLDAHGRVWFAGGSGGLWRREGIEWVEDAPPGNGAVNALAEDAAGRLWAGLDSTSAHALFWRDGGSWTPLACAAEAGVRVALNLVGDARGHLVVDALRAIHRFSPGVDGTACEGPVLEQGWASWLSVDADGILWLSLHGRPGIEAWRDGRSVLLDLSRGLADDAVEGHGHDAQERVWVLLPDGRVDVYDRKDLLGVSTRLERAPEPGDGA